MACSNCYNNCSEITSDKCVKYTGVDVPVLGIQNGDSLSYVEQALITFLTSTLTGAGIKINIDEDLYCELVSQYLQECSEVTALDLFKALVQAACNLQTQVDVINTTLTALNADYDVDCLDGVTDSSDTHDVVQAIITKLCALDVSLTALALDVDTNYVKLADLNTLIQAYLDSLPTNNTAASKMVPYTVVEYYGPLSNYPETGDSFDISGAGQNYWEDVYLCNGLNGTPDKRGRVGVGAIVGVGGGTLDSAVDPGASAFNPNYVINTPVGANSVILDSTQIPPHTHVITDPGHTHVLDVTTSGSDAPNGGLVYPVFNTTTDGGGTVGTDPLGLLAESSETNISLGNTGGGLGHSIVQPVLPCYYIMYIPS